jgi:indolepyruvate ferredoxin oxidoreductase beta subunit
VGDAAYPSLKKIQEAIRDLAQKFWFVDATDAALALGSPIFTNIVMVGALAGTHLIPVTKKTFEEAIRENFPGKTHADNLKAFHQGMEMTKGH